MDMKMLIEKTLITSNGKQFNTYDDIAFTILNAETNHLDRVIGRIVHLGDSSLVLDRVEIDRFKSNPNTEYEFYYKDMDDVNYVA